MDKYEKAEMLTMSCEGVRLQAYQDSAGIWTIGVGLARTYLDGTPICKDDSCTMDQAKEWLHEYMQKNVYPRVDSWIENFNVTDRLYASCCAFTYNVGHLGASIIKSLNNGENEQIKAAFLEYCMVKNTEGKLEFCPGLFNRRMKEINFFLNEDGSLK